MKYQVEYTNHAVRQLKKMDRKIAALILSYIEEKLVDCNDPKSYGKALKGNHQGEWSYRVGDYRILANIDDYNVIIIIIETGHRSAIY